MMRDKIKIPTEIWVELYSELSEHILEFSAIDSVCDEDGERTPEAEDKFCDIVGDVEIIMDRFFIKER